MKRDTRPGPANTVNPLPLAYSTAELFFGASTVFIEHRGNTYQLRITSNDKLILTK